MFSTLRDRFGIGGVVAVIALVFAMLGGAYAANNSGDGKSTASAKKGKQGKRGKPGPKGATGPMGPQGPAGANGKDGTNGQNGAKGETGSTGEEGADGDDGATGATGDDGSIGATGATGESGFTSTLPPGATETGAWAFGKAGGTSSNVPVTFAIPLASDLGGSEVHFINKADEEVVVDLINEVLVKTPAPAECSGDATAPTAAPGHLCVYAGELSAGGLEFYGSNLIYPPAVEDEFAFSGAGAGVTGARMLFSGTTTATGWGSWAVTGCGTGFPCPS